MRLRRIVLGLLTATLVVLLGAAILVVPLRLSSRPSSDWTEFSLGPPAGRSASVQADGIRADGITLRVAIAIAYDMPAVRVLGPSWLAEQRYSLRAVLTRARQEEFRSLLKQELDRRLHLETHIERPTFDVFVLSVTDGSRLVRSAAPDAGTWLGDDQARLRGTDMTALASALQTILGKPIVDETGITGWYDLDFEWSGDRVAAMTAALSDRYGLRLTPARRELDALVVDRVRRDPSLVLLSHVGRAAQRTPPAFRRHLAEILSIR
jgi:uncharacterized protein (TIGR03435 family)